jgi:hypothetical protein
MASVGGMETVRLHAVRREELDLGLGDYLFAQAVVDGQSLPPVAYFSEGWRGIPWPTAKPRLEMVRQGRKGNGWASELRLTADAYVRFCHLILGKEAGSYWLEDSFFDLPAGASHTITIRSERPLALGQVHLGDWHTTWP